MISVTRTMSIMILQMIGVCRSVSVTSRKEAVGQLKVIYPDVRT